jgi:hypothetical protein
MLTISADFMVPFRVWLLYRILLLVLAMGALASHWLRLIPCRCSLMCSGGFPTSPSVRGRRGSDPSRFSPLLITWQLVPVGEVVLYDPLPTGSWLISPPWGDYVLGLRPG